MLFDSDEEFILSPTGIRRILFIFVFVLNCLAMISFILNDQLINTEKPPGLSLLDFIRYEEDLPGTKSGCREGDCGTCTVLEGTLENGRMTYKSIVSCLTPLGNVHGKHIVTIEGIQPGKLTPLQEAFVNNGAVQCGFCTPGFIMAITAFCLSDETPELHSAIASISGNICRCTGYKSIERAIYDITLLVGEKDLGNPAEWLVRKEILPGYFLEIPERIGEIGYRHPETLPGAVLIAGGTDLMVRKAGALPAEEFIFLHDSKDHTFIRAEEGKCHIGASVTVSELEHSPVFCTAFPEIIPYLELFASRPIRNMATIAGNMVNASPIGDLTIIFLVLDAELKAGNGEKVRSLPLRDFYHSYKNTGLNRYERITEISFDIPPEPYAFSFEKVSKRDHLDIASVNSAFLIFMEGVKIKECRISAGGVSPVPMLLHRTGHFLKGKTVSPEMILQSAQIMQEEISPISDVRGSAEYKRLLLRQLLFAHFLKSFPDRIRLEDLLGEIRNKTTCG